MLKFVVSDEELSRGFCFQCISPQFRAGPIIGEDSKPNVSAPEIIVSNNISSPFCEKISTTKLGSPFRVRKAKGWFGRVGEILSEPKFVKVSNKPGSYVIHQSYLVVIGE